MIQTAFRLPNDPSRGEAYGTVFGLLAATGLRISEALTLRRRDVDLKQGVLTVADTKFKKTRYVPLHPSVLRALKRYARRRDEKPTNAGADYFFTISGRPLVLGTLESDFQKISSHLQWRSRGDRPRPRIHDLRHSFICRRIERWYAQGLNVNHLMLSLSTYVGHAMPSSTYWYLTVTPRLMALAARYSAQSRSQRTK